MKNIFQIIKTKLISNYKNKSYLNYKNQTYFKL